MSRFFQQTLLLLFLGFLKIGFAQQIPAPPTSSEILLQLKKLKVLGSVLYVAAHPDDENNALLPYLAKEKLYRTAYLSLTRGDGGQNLIGDEQGIELGMIRTQELLAARQVDGAEQYFSTAYEFGFSKSFQEALKIWDSTKVLADIVWVIRKYQPDVIINRFPPDKRAGHGHHAASAVLSIVAFKAAADPKQFPEQFKYGVKPWQAKRLLMNGFSFGGTNTTSEDQLKINIGGFNPLIGKSYGELGAEARTMHKSQGEGRPRRRGENIEYFATIGGEAPKTDLMDGIDISWKRVDPTGETEKLVDETIKNFDVSDPSKSIPQLIKLYDKLTDYKAALKTGTYDWQKKKLDEVKELIAECAGLYVEATTAKQYITSGDSARVSVYMINRSATNITAFQGTLNNDFFDIKVPLPNNKVAVFEKNVAFNQSFMESQPYWLREEMTPGMFTVSDQNLVGKPMNDPLNVKINLELQLTSSPIDVRIITIERPIQFKILDPVKGDVFKPVFITPAYLVYSNNNLIVFKKGENDSAKVSVWVNEFTKTGPQKAMMQLKGNGYMAAKYDSTFTAFPNGTKKYEFTIYNYLANAKLEKDKIKFLFYPNTKDLKYSYNNAARTIEYDHIPTLYYYYQDAVQVLNIDLKTGDKKIGYIVGAGDKVPEALQAMHYDVTILTEADITEDNLKKFDAVIVGIRAYNLFEWLTNKNDILNNYVSQGGNLIVQYLKSNTVGIKPVKVGPYPFIVNSLKRVTEEDAKLNFLLPNHPVLNYPNKITEDDFKGWIQERSTYQAEQLDSHYEMPIGMHDTDEPESNGSLAIAKYGKGNFVYCSLVFFRQLPAGVPGAFRLMANLIALPKNDNPMMVVPVK